MSQTELEQTTIESTKPSTVSRRQFLSRGVLLGLGLVTTGPLLAGCDLFQNRPLPGKTPEPAPNTGGGDGRLPTPVPTATAKPTETPVPATATAEPTKVPATPTPEAAKKLEKILPEYSVFYGQMQQENAPANRGSAIIANIPGFPNQLYAFFEANNTGGGYLYEINKIGEDNLEMKGKGGIKIVLKDPKTLSGRLEKFSDASPNPWVYDLKYYGTGKDKLIEAAKKVIATEVAHSPAEWANVSKDSLDSLAFRKITLP